MSHDSNDDPANRTDETTPEADPGDETSGEREQTTARTRRVVLAGDEADVEDGPVLVRGAILGAGDRTVGESGTPITWPAAVLQDAAESGAFEGVPLVDDHPDPEASQPPARSVIGEVTRVEYDEDAGAVVFEGELDDPDLARSIDRGRLDVSAVLAAETVADDEGEHEATRILGVRDVGIVARGAAGSNYVETIPGDASSADAVTAEALSATFGETEPSGSGNADRDPEGEGVEDAPADAGPGDETVDGETVDALRRENREMREVFTAALAEQTALPFDAATLAERFTFEDIQAALASTDTDAEGVVAAALTPNPRTGGDGGTAARSEALSAGDGADEQRADDGALAPEDRDELLGIQRRVELLADRAPTHTETLRAQAAELAGVEDYERIDFDALSQH